MNENIKRVTIIGMLCAVAYIVMLACRIPIVLFLKYEPKDVIITLGGLIWGPAVAVLTSVIVSLVEMVTVSDNGIYGMIMNIVSTCSFAIVVSLIYKKKRTISGAILGLIVGCVSVVTIMTLWNIIVVPLYMKTPIEVIMPMIPTVFIPFNLLKAGLNVGFILLLYKPLTNALKKSGLVTEKVKPQKNNSMVIFLISVVLIGICVSLFVVLSDSKSKSNKDGEAGNSSLVSGVVSEQHSDEVADSDK
jgi:riboflavin transporter FmnP